MSQKRKGQTPEGSKAGALQERRNPFRFLKGLAKSQMIPQKGVSPMVTEETSYQFAGLAAAL